MTQSVRAVDGTPDLRFDILDIAYDERVLEPRPWTAEQSRWGAELLAACPRVGSSSCAPVPGTSGC